MAEQKMRCGPKRTNSNRPKVYPKKSLEQNLKEDCEPASVIWGSPDPRCSFFMFLAFEFNGSCNLIALPLPCSDNSNHVGSGAQVKRDNFLLPSPPPVDSFGADQQKEWAGSCQDVTCSVNSLTGRSILQLDGHHQSQSKFLANKAANLTEFSNDDTDGMILDEFDAVNSSEAPIDSSKAQRNARKNARKKARKKAKRRNKLSSDSCPTELEVLSEECPPESSTSESCTNNDVDNGDGPVSYETPPGDSLLDRQINLNDSEGDCNGISPCSEISETCTSSIDGMDASEATITSEIQNLTGDHTVFDSEDGIQTKDLGVSILKGLEDKHGQQIQCCDDMSSKGFSDIPDCLILDSISVGWSSEDSVNASYEDSPDAGYDVEPSNEAKMVPRNSVANFHGHVGKKNNHAIWQKVQRNDTNAVESSNESEKVNLNCSQLDTTLKEPPLLKRNCNVAEAKSLLKPEDKKQSKVKVSRKSKKKSSPVSKQDCHCSSRKGSHALKARSNACAMVNIQKNEMSIVPVRLNGQKALGGISQSYSQNGCREPEFLTNGVECIAPEPIRSLLDCAVELEPLERCSAVSNMKDQVAGDQNSSIFECQYSLNQSDMHQQPSAVHLKPFIGKEVSEIGKEVSLSEYSKQEDSCASMIEKWKPIGKKDLGLTNLGRPDRSSQAHADDPTAEVCTQNNFVERKSSSSSEDLDTSNGSGNANCSSEDKSLLQDACTPKVLNNKHPSVDSFTHACKDKDVSAFGADSGKISEAISDAYRVQQLSKSFQMATGSPIAEFERFLHAASPIICRSKNVKICQNCSQDEVDGSLCRHETPGISLSSLWKWYEKLGSYGLEVRSGDYEYSKRLGFHCFASCAYFVPSLSAVQLFKKPKWHPAHNGDRIPKPGVLKTWEMSKTSQSSSNIGHLLSILVPRSHAEETSFHTPENQLPSSPVSSVSQSVDTTIADSPELLLEYFEYDQPQQRKPLFEKIKELVSGDGPSRYRVYGDATKLETMNLDELHHSSWYSVAWYPIYRIPDGEFHAAFLTYHSFGHLVHRSPASNSHKKDAFIVSPVVGLQSYNAQRERWFHLKPPRLSQTLETPSLNPSELLRDRLQTLEQTSSLISQAEVRKGNLKSANRHPDFEFFLSRRR